MSASYPARYRDEFGEEATVIQTDGKTLRMVLRGVEFKATYLDDWEPVAINAEQTISFPLHRDELHSYTIEFEIPIPVVLRGVNFQGSLRVHLDLGKPEANGGVDREDLQLELTVDGEAFKSSGDHGWFEDELTEIQSILPEHSFIKCCFNCAFSDYSPYGHGMFGGMTCFRDIKQRYLLLASTAAYLDICERYDERVQETYLCPEFEKRVPGTGYRG